MTKMRKRKSKNFQYDVSLSFAGEDRVYVKKVADTLRDRGLKVFYDEYEKAELWGKDLYAHLDDIYQNAARYCVIFVSKPYAKKLWSNHERESAQARAFRENKEYILPARFDDTAIPGLRETVGYIDLRKVQPAELAELIIEKVGVPEKTDYLPPNPDRLFRRLGVTTGDEKDVAKAHAHRFFNELGRMSSDERRVVTTFFLNSCPDELPDNVHMDLDLLRRLTGSSIAKLKRLLSGIQSLGFYFAVRDERQNDEYLGSRQEVGVLEWHDMGITYPGNATAIANEMITTVAEDYCQEHADSTLARLDFSGLGPDTTTKVRRPTKRKRARKSKLRKTAV
jgi:hypothetical protein